jgi:hypothetical protein
MTKKIALLIGLVLLGSATRGRQTVFAQAPLRRFLFSSDRFSETCMKRPPVA